MRKISDKNRRENHNKPFIFSDSFFWRMRFACWITKATDRYSEYVILTAYPQQQWLHERAAMLPLYWHCLYCLILKVALFFICYSQLSALAFSPGTCPIIIHVRDTQLLHQPMHIYKIYKLYTLKPLRHGSVLRPSSGSYILTYSMVQSPSWAANWFEASQEIPRISRNPKVHYRTHKRPPPVSILGQPNPVHMPTYHLL